MAINSLKKLQSEIKKKKAAMAVLEKEIDQRKKDLKQLEDQVRDAAGKIKAMTKNVTISEHAIIRYIERIEGRDMNEVREAILPKQV